MSKFLLHLFLLVFLGLHLQAATLNTKCEKSEINGQVTGVNSKALFTIASVSKVFTTDWALRSLGPHYRFKTRLYITAVSGGLYDVHIEGDNYPYFDRVMFQFLISELNRLNITKINDLTYDENFQYTSVVKETRPSGAQLITQELRRDTQSINTSLNTLSAKLLTLENIHIPTQLNISIKDIHALSKNKFTKSPNTLVYTMASSEMARTLKEMNRNSNNFTADTLFTKLSTQEKFTDFLLTRTKVPKNEVQFYNGYGYPIITDNGKIYNKASCNAVVEVLSDLKLTLSQLGMGLQDVMAVAGKDSAGDGDSTLTTHYGSDFTSGAVIAKTGTVGDTLSLAGMVITPNQNIFFHTSFKYNGTALDKDQSYIAIRKWIEGILKVNSAGHPLEEYRPRTFLPFDQGSFLQAEVGYSQP
jgi:serine-type D-Ala-D-Ala carboxypeptidase/endopeptidase (penicillin-binding protein 4)